MFDETEQSGSATREKVSGKYHNNKYQNQMSRMKLRFDCESFKYRIARRNERDSNK